MAVMKSNNAKICAGIIIGVAMLVGSLFARGNDLFIMDVDENGSAIEIAVNGTGSRIKMLVSDSVKPVFQGFSDT